MSSKRKSLSPIKVGSLAALAVAGVLIYSATAPSARGKASADTVQPAAGEQPHFKNGWRQGKIETALMLNDQLNDVDIVVVVEGATATLKGIVANSVQRDLAKAIAVGAEGIESVNDQLQVDPDKLVEQHVEVTHADPSFAQTLLDATITAKVKLGLLASDPLAGFDIGVETSAGIVTLSGDVDAEPSRQAAERVARDMDDVRKVVNNLVVEASTGG